MRGQLFGFKNLPLTPEKQIRKFYFKGSNINRKQHGFDKARQDCRLALCAAPPSPDEAGFHTRSSASPLNNKCR
ncbi:MAG: hypothetical protein J6L90_05200 [Clostridia bacterium]|nr:hypothetical protein [Clostridia bacterium]